MSRKQSTKRRNRKLSRARAAKLTETFEKAYCGRIAFPENIALLYPLLCAITMQDFARMLARRSEWSQASYNEYNNKLEGARRLIAAGDVQLELAAAIRPLLAEIVHESERGTDDAARA